MHTFLLLGLKLFEFLIDALGDIFLELVIYFDVDNMVNACHYRFENVIIHVLAQVVNKSRLSAVHLKIRLTLIFQFNIIITLIVLSNFIIAYQLIYLSLELFP